MCPTMKSSRCSIREYCETKSPPLTVGRPNVVYLSSFDEDGSGSINMTEFLLKLRVS